jgi:quinol monooxygenase YgiN
MSTTITVTKEVTTLINVLTSDPENQQKLIELLRSNTESVVTRLDGWISTSFIASRDQRHVLIYSQWRDLASVEAMRTNPDMVAYFPRIAALAALDSSPATSSTTTAPDAGMKAKKHAGFERKTRDHCRLQPGSADSRWSTRSLPAREHDTDWPRIVCSPLLDETR